MAQLPDVNCLVKAVLDQSGKVMVNGGLEFIPAKVTVRYVVANDSHKAAGPLYVVGSLRRNGVKITPPGQPNVVPAQQITVQPDTVWKKEWVVTEDGTYVASILADVGALVNEEDESNNKGSISFTLAKVPA